MPLTFIYQNNSSIDKQIGELSYPIYMVHMLVIWVVGNYRSKLGDMNQLLFAILCILLTIVLAFITNKIISEPMELLRNKRRNNLSEPAHKEHVDPSCENHQTNAYIN
jgi:peptidoglycan/LPS O-acetylase OafA/YrhL